MDSDQAAPAQVARRRAARACDFCRKRKMKCGNEQPQCTNCKSYGKQCIYSELPKKSRPSSTQISELEEQNRRLKARLNSLKPSELPNSRPLKYASVPAAIEDIATGSSLSFPSPEQETLELGSPVASKYPHSQSGPQNQPPSDYQASYYGRTSALFDDGSSESRVLRGSISNNRGELSEKTQLQLMGEAAKQRQMEAINYNAGRLDFDGVDPELGMHLLSLHWNRQHHSFLITYRPSFMRDMACQGPYFSKLLLNAIFFGASKFSPRPELRSDGEHARSAGLRFRQRVRDLLGGALDRSEITTIQALLIMTSSLFALGDERSAAWLYAGTAFRMIIDLGLHVDDPLQLNMRRLSEEDFEIRRRVFWGAFVVDKIQSLYQGRPMSLQEADTRVSMIFQDRFEELEHWMPFAYSGTRDYPGSPAYSISTFTELCKLSVIMNDILSNVYAQRSAKRDPDRLAEDLKSIHGDLENWETALPLHLRFDVIESTGIVPPPHVLSLQAMQNVLLILLHRPFVSEGHLQSTSPSIPVNSFLVCAKAATKIVQLLRIYDETFSIQHAPYLMSYATYVGATIHVRIASQRGSGSEAYASLRTCLAVFNKNQETNWAVRRAKTVILNLMKRMHVVLPDESSVPDKNKADRSATPGSGAANTIPLSNQQAAQRNMEMEGTLISENRSHDQTARDLDMDAIIQSFLHEQSSNSLGNEDSRQQYIPVQGFGPDPLDPRIGSNSSGMSQNLPQQGFDMGNTGPTWNMMGYQDNSSFAEDMLFGFNGASVDGLW